MNNTKFNITTDIRKLLTANTGLTANVSSRIYPIVAPEGTVGDMVLYYRDQYSKEYTQMGIYSENCKVFLAIVSDNYDKSIQIVQLVNDIIEGVHTDSKGEKYECRLMDSTEDFQDFKYLQILLFEIK